MGATHALEADHLAAMSALATDGKGRLALRGMAWGLGHTVTLFCLSAAVFLLSVALTEARSASLEFVVGVMLVGLGLDVLRRMYRNRGHVHAHGPSHHEAHSHPHGFPWRAMGVGLVHGAAGSAGLIALAAAATGSASIALSYVLCFGLGSMLGMAALSAIVSLPLVRLETRSAKLNSWLQIGVAVTVVGIVLGLIHQTPPLAWGTV